jgi:hypothetical protein
MYAQKLNWSQRNGVAEARQIIRAVVATPEIICPSEKSKKKT